MANATKHYLHYPEEENVPIYLAYGFRPIFLLLAPYIIITAIMWAFVWAGVANPFGNYLLEWHIYEYLFGVGVAGIMAFVFTGVPELFPGVVPLIGKKLKYVMLLWIAGRISFWMIDILPLFLVALINLSLLVVVIAWAFKPVVLDPLQRHSSLGYALATMLIVEGWFYGSMMGIFETPALEILKAALSIMMILLLLALRRVNMEVINEIMEDEGMDDKFFAKPFRYNLAIFSIALFAVVEFFYGTNSALGWIGLAAFAAILGILNDYNLEFEKITFKPYTIYLSLVYVLMACGYGFMGIDIIYGQGTLQNHFRHFLSTGAFGLSFYMVMMIVSYVHTGRHLKSDFWMVLSVVLVVIAAILRVSIAYFPEAANLLYVLSTILWIMPFGIYYWRFYRYLLLPRADGVKG